MPLGTSYLNDTTAVAVGNGQHAELSAAQMTTKYGAGNLKTPTKDFTVHVDGHVFTGRKNVPFVTTPEMLAKLLAAGAPIA